MAQGFSSARRFRIRVRAGSVTVKRETPGHRVESAESEVAARGLVEHTWNNAFKVIRWPAGVNFDTNCAHGRALDSE